MLPLRYKTWVLKKQLPIDTDLEPSKVTGKDCSAVFKEISDKKIILDTSSSRLHSLIFVFLLILGGVGVYEATSNLILLDYIIISLSWFFAGFAFLWFIFFQKKQVIFDREKGIVSIPGPFWLRNVDIPFKDVVAITRKENRYYGVTKVLNIYRPDGYKIEVGINGYNLETLKNDWAFYCWYMDKSRPLPPSPVFDKYRSDSYTSVAAKTA